MPYKSFEQALDSRLDTIKTSLPTFFTSADFIKVAKDCFPNEYAAILRGSSYRALHTWVARWYLSRRFKSVREEDIITAMGHISPNKVWEK